MKNVWEILGISPTDNKRAVKKAYAAKLAQYHPEDHPQEFKEIQDAYTSIMASFERDYSQQTTIRTDLKSAFNKKDSIYTIDSTQTETPIEDALLDSLSKEEEDTTLYDAIDLDWSFRHIDDGKQDKNTEGPDLTFNIDVNKTEQPNDTYPDFQFDVKTNRTTDDSSQQDSFPDDVYVHEEKVDEETLRRQLSDLYYEKFLERLRYRKSVDMLESLILNEAFFHQMEDPYFYEKISQTICSRLASFDYVTLSFLYDSFLTLKDQYQYPTEPYDVPTAIQVFIKKEQVTAKRNKMLKMFGFPILIIAIFLIYIAVTLENRVNKEQQDEQIRDIGNQVLVEKGKRREEASNTLNQALKETYKISYSCSINSTFSDYGKSIIYFCNNKEKSYYGHVTFDENGTITKLTKPEIIKKDKEKE